MQPVLLSPRRQPRYLQADEKRRGAPLPTRNQEAKPQDEAPQLNEVSDQLVEQPKELEDRVLEMLLGGLFVYDEADGCLMDDEAGLVG